MARPVILGASHYRQYFDKVFDGKPKYVSPFVEMEFRRSFVCAAIDLYFVFKLQSVKTVADLIAVATNQFQKSALKAALQIASQLFTNRKIPFDLPSAKTKALYYFAELIIRIQSQFHSSFTNTGKDGTKCRRASIPFDIKLEHAETGFTKFREEFGDVKLCRSRCSIDKFFIQRHKKDVEKYVQQAKKLKSSKENDGFKDIAEELSQVLATKGKVCSCRLCGKIGDAIITLDTDRSMALHHTDNSFDHLCPPVSQAHQKHQSETAMLHPAPQPKI